MTDLQELENEAIYVLREVFAQFQNPVILCSGGKDSLVVVHLAKKAFWPAKVPFKLMHVDTGHNFPEVLEFRDQLAEELGVECIVGKVQDDIDSGASQETGGKFGNRNRLQSHTLLRTIEENKIDCCIGGGRRDEEKARAKERFFSHRDDFGQWDPKHQRPELWNIFNGRHHEGEHFRVFPISNWTELDVWMYIQQENIQLPELYFAREREVVARNGSFICKNEFNCPREDETVETRMVRFRTLGDITITGGMESQADTLDKIIEEVASLRATERGRREDDKFSETAMEDRKKEGYF